MSCREPEEVSYGSEEQRGSSLTERLQIPLISTLSVKGNKLSRSPPALCPTEWDYVKHRSSVLANQAAGVGNSSQNIIIGFTLCIQVRTKIPYQTSGRLESALAFHNSALELFNPTHKEEKDQNYKQRVSELD